MKYVRSGRHTFAKLSVFILILGLGHTARAEQFGEEEDASIWGAATVSIGRALGPDAIAPTFIFEPDLSVALNQMAHLNLYAAIERPADPWLDFRAPKVILTYNQDTFWSESWRTTVKLSLSALELERWSTDGYMMRPAVHLQMDRDLAENFTLSFRVGPVLQLSRYHQRTDGTALPRYGFSERVGVSWYLGDFTLDARLILEQLYADGWGNYYGTVEQLSYEMTKDITVGMAHELLSAVVDDSTGGYRSVRVFDDRESRLSLFLQVNL